MTLGRQGWFWITALGTLLLGGCTGNRNLSPEHFGDGGSGAGSIAAIVGIIATVGFLVARTRFYLGEHWDHELDDDEAEGVANLFLFLSLCSFVLTISVVQFLPATQTGIAIIPAAPWSYATTGGSALAWIAWIFFGFYGLVLFASLGADSTEEGADFAKGAIGNLAIAAVFTFCASFCTVTPALAQPTDPNSPPPPVISAGLSSIDPAVLAKIPQEHLDRLKKMVAELAGFVETKASFTADKDRLVGQLKELNVTATTKLEPNTRAADLVDELKVLAGHLKMLESKVTAYELAVVRQESVIRRIARQMKLESLAGITDQDLTDLDAAKIELDQKLEEVGKPTAVSAIEVDELLKKELGP